jgi:biotin carboxyl carrier protein
MEKISLNNELIEYDFSNKDNVCEVKIGYDSLNVIITKYGEYYLLENKKYNKFELADVYHAKDYSIVWIDDEEYLIKNVEENIAFEDDIKETNIKSPMPGIIKEIKFKENEEVKKGDTVIVLESMKVLNELKSSVNGIVSKIFVINGAQVGPLELLLEIKPQEEK